MRRLTKIVVYGFVILAVLGIGFFYLVLPGLTDRMLNPVHDRGPYSASAEAIALHRTLTVADLHADSLLFGRDLLQRGSYAHVDIPRLAEGNVALQVFSVVSKTPRLQNLESNSDDTDNITIVALALRWPMDTWTSLKARALYQASRLMDFAALSDNRLVVVRSKGDLRRFLERRVNERGIVAGVLALEGAQVLEGDAGNLGAIFDAGYRMMSLAHFFDTELGGSVHGVDKGGLTELGRAVVAEMEVKGMVIDLSHASAQQFEDVIAIATKPVVVSHTGVKGTCNNTRNLTDAQIDGVARTRGVIGIGFWTTATCGQNAAAIAKAIRYTADRAGVDHVGLGSDYDGVVDVPFDASGMVLLTEALLAEGFNAEEIGKIMGGNQMRVLEEVLPN